MSFAFTRANHIIDCNGQILNSSISSSSIDMNNSVIINHNTPVNGTDVVNKDYVDNSVSNGVSTILINLSGTAYTTILSDTEGDIYISVKNIVTGGPSASFQLSKSDQLKHMHYIRMSSSAGTSTEERLNIRWEPSSNIELRKTGLNYDGQYRIKYIKN